MLRLSLLLLLSVCLAACGSGKTGVEVRDAWVRATPPGAGVAAAYFTLVNHDDADARLVSVRTPAASRVEIHTMTVDESGVMRMRQIEDGLPVAAGAELKMASGGLHLMLIAPPQPLADGSSTSLTLRFADGREQTVQAPVRAAAAEAGGDADHHH